MKKEVKIIFHIDLNAFFATVAQINEPYLKDKVFVVGGSSISSRGVISTASYNARRLGIHAGMPLKDALRIYPTLLIVPTEYEEYKRYSNIFFEFLENYSDKMIRGSIDEAFLDVTELAKTKHPIKIAQEIQVRLDLEYGLGVSIGIAPTLFLAKMASDMMKPMGITVLRKRDIVSKIFPLPIKDLFGMGIKTYPLMQEVGINTIGQFADPKNKELILSIITEDSYNSFINRILGNSTNIVDPTKYDIPQSISNEITFNYNVENTELLLLELKELFNTVHKRLTKAKLLTKTVSIKIRKINFDTITRSKSLLDHSNDYELLYEILENLFYDNYEEDALRLIGVSLSNIIEEDEYKEDINLFTYLKHPKD